MNYDSGTHDNHAMKNNRQQGLLHLEQALSRLLGRKPADGLRWTGTKTDLFVIAHLMYMDADPIGDDGQPMTFSALVARLAAILHVKVPRNPRSYVTKDLTNKHCRRLSFLDRYCWLLFHDGDPDPLARYIDSGGSNRMVEEAV